MPALKKIIRHFVPSFVLSGYHLSIALLGALLYGFPSRKLIVIAVTGTKGKSSTTEYVNAVFEAAGHTTALVNSIRVKVAGDSEDNPAGRSTPGRFFLSRTLARAVRAGCTVAILELTSEGARQHRHRGIALDALLFLNLAPEHIESHGSYQAYADAKFQLGRALVRSSKRPRIIVAHSDDQESARYLALPVDKRIPFSLNNNEPWGTSESGGYFTFDAVRMNVALPGEFSLRNALAAATVAKALGIAANVIAAGVARVTRIPGRAEEIREGQHFTVVVDYAHTPDSLKALCDAYAGKRKICILGSAGGGRDTWKRPVMGKVAEENCAYVILTTDAPYDEDPEKIMDEMRAGMSTAPLMIVDRREAIRRAFSLAQKDDVVLITGMGVDAIVGRGGVKTAWNDVSVAQEELEKLKMRQV